MSLQRHHLAINRLVMSGSAAACSVGETARRFRMREIAGEAY